MDDAQLTEHRIEEEKRLSEIEGSIQKLSEDIQELKVSVKEMVAAWQAASLVLSFIKGIAGLAVTVGTFVAFIKGGK